MRRRAFIVGIGSFLAQPRVASAASPARPYRIGFLDTAPRERNVNFAAFHQVLLERGYTEGQNLTSNTVRQVAATRVSRNWRVNWQACRSMSS